MPILEKNPTDKFQLQFFVTHLNDVCFQYIEIHNQAVLMLTNNE